MSGKQSPEERYRLARVAGLAMTMPFMLMAAPLIGLWGGKWLDGKLGTAPWLMIIGLVLGLIAGGREFYRLAKQMMKDL